MPLTIASLALIAVASAADPHLVFDDYLPPGLEARDVADGFIRPRDGAHLVSMARGRVLNERPLVVAHTYYVAAERREVHITYRCTLPVTPERFCDAPNGLRIGDRVQKGDALFSLITTSSRSPRIQVTMSTDEDPATFAGQHAQLFVPQSESTLVLFDKQSYRMRVLQRGTVTFDLRVGYGQAKGNKTVRGDNKTPRGMYFVVQKSKGPFGGEYGAYFGGHWIKVNYPGARDAERGREAGLVDERTAEKISKAWRARKLTPQNTKLGSGIGFHGWIDNWSNDDAHLSWGCMVMHNDDIAQVYDELPLGTMVVVF